MTITKSFVGRSLKCISLWSRGGEFDCSASPFFPFLFSFSLTPPLKSDRKEIDVGPKVLRDEADGISVSAAFRYHSTEEVLLLPTLFFLTSAVLTSCSFFFSHSISLSVGSSSVLPFLRSSSDSDGPWCWQLVALWPKAKGERGGEHRRKGGGRCDVEEEEEIQCYY